LAKLPILESAIDMTAHKGKPPPGQQHLPRSGQVALGHDESAVVEDLAVDLHLAGQSGETVEIALQLVTGQMVTDPRQVDAATLTDDELVNHQRPKRHRPRGDYRADEPADLGLRDGGHMGILGATEGSGVMVATRSHAAATKASDRAICRSSLLDDRTWDRMPRPATRPSTLA
jgi:hypothetical protein